ncbi:B3 domain-containing transcription repressor VAL1-like isoform X2 [Nymphaea colorata]|nr:B3 domain-containing transcription repressor VAL1-like isoform X1 [Nymphaea colorata]XP_049936604.1 B3 domain-containing transcription repressor VAL1-like isoform X2 [Nymphaea colorata]
MMSESTSPLKVCFNPQCRASGAEKWRKGWMLRSGEIVELCYRCGSAYEEQRFCEDFHADVAGWRNCETCGKRLHCGCIASVHRYYLLDAGGVECVICAKKNVPGVEQSLFRPPSWFPSLSHLDGLTDQSSKVWGQIPPTGSDLRQLQKLPLVWHYISQNSESYPGMRHPDAGNPSDRFPGKVCPATCSMEKKNVEDSHEKDSDNSHSTMKFHIYDNLGNRISDVGHDSSFVQEAYMDGLRDPSYIAGRKSNEAGKVISAEEFGRKKSVNVPTCEPQDSYLNIKHLPSLLKDGISNVSGPSLPFSRETNLKHSNDPQQQGYLQSSQKQYFSTCHAGLGSSKETQSQVSSISSYTDGKVKNQSILSRYCPRITAQELQKISGNSNSVVTPLFEKMLSASDAGRVGRLVLPKKCAEAYFPAISHPEGLPLRIQDANGKEWVFQFRFWPNNNSRMYVLEGVTSCIQSMQLQAGDIVTFSRIDPEGKLVMGFRKASSTLSHQDGRSLENQNGEVPNRIGACNEVVTALPAYSAKVAFDSTGDSSRGQIGPISVVSYLDKTSKQKASSGSAAFSLDKRKKGTCGSKRKRLSVDDKSAAKMKPTWEEAQKLLQPPPNHSPTIVVIEGHEFEEYEEPPVFGNRPIFAAKELGSSCSSAREISAEQLQGHPAKSARKQARAAKRMRSSKCLSKLDTLADLAILDEKEQEQHPPANSTTTKHPRHRPGCSCIVCIQPPSGQGPKHEPNCTCNVCLMVKRRFHTLMLRRKKLQSEKEAENDEENHQSSPEKSEEKIEASDGKMVESEKQGNKPIKKSSDSSRDSENNEGPLSCSAYNKEEIGGIGKGQIDLNCQPEREEDFFPNSDLVSTCKPFNEYVWTGISCSSADHEQQIEAHAADPVDDPSKEAASDGHEPDWQGADAGVSGMTNLSKPGPIQATTAA